MTPKRFTLHPSLCCCQQSPHLSIFGLRDYRRVVSIVAIIVPLAIVIAPGRSRSGNGIHRGGRRDRGRGGSFIWVRARAILPLFGKTSKKTAQGALNGAALVACS